MKLASILVAAIAAGVFVVSAPSASFAADAPKQEKKTEDKKVTVKSGDSLSSIADANKTTFVRLYNANDFLKDPNLINEGDQIRIPGDNEDLPNRYAEYETAVAQYVAAQTPVYANYQAQPNYYAANTATTYRGSTAGNTYYQGYCTWYAKDRRPDLPNMLGNGGQWVNNAAAQGYATGTEARAGAIAETAGHVTYVESVNGNGTITISEMNGTAGFGNVGTRVVNASDYRYIY